MLVTSIAATLLSLGSLASAITYRAYSSTNSCSGSNFYCNDGGAVCCSFPTSYGYSFSFENLPAGSQGQGYTNGGCSSYLFSVFGPGTKCWNGGGARATNGNWFHSASRKRSSDKTCTSPSVFEYTDAEGQFRAIKVLDGASAEIIADHYSSANFTALAEYELAA